MKALDATAGRRRRLEAGACFALLAWCVQALLPFLVALEIHTAAAETAHHHHVAATESVAHRETGSAHHQEHAPCLAACPICMALSAAHAFTPPALVPLPLPSATAFVRLTDTGALSFARQAPALYDARAPPALL